MLYFVCHGYELMGFCLTVLGDKLHIGNTEHPRKVCATVTFPAN